MEIMLYTPRSSNRLSYIATYLFETLLTTKVSVTNEKEVFLAFTGVKLNYSGEKMKGEFLSICPHKLLFEQGVKIQNTSTKIKHTCPVIFISSTDSLSNTKTEPLGFDPLAACFYILTRYEEYLPFTTDQHGRYSAKLSWAYEHQCLQLPIIWEWTLLLKKALQVYFPDWKPVPPGYNMLPTYDIDIPWAFRYRSWRGLGRTVLDVLQGKWPLVRARLMVLLQKQNDPFFVFSQLKGLHQSSGFKPTVFWLLGDNNRYDINPSHRLPALRKLIQEVRSWANIGIHPSYASFGKTRQIAIEKERLEEISGEAIMHSRQHFLRLSLPDTYRQLIAAGIWHDYTMGYADEIGYRAGTTEAFRWYDLEKEEITKLWIQPFAVMDVTLKNYLRLSPSAAQEQLKILQTYCQKQQLNFSTLWHNSSFSDIHGWSGWWEVYLSLFSQNEESKSK